MDSDVQGIFICPSCDGVSALTEDGDALCGECGNRFSVSVPKVTLKKVALKASDALLPASQGVIQRNVPLKQASAQDYKSADKSPEPIIPKADFEDLHTNKKRRRKVRKKSKTPTSVYLKWFFVWLGVVGLILVVISYVQDGVGSGGAGKLSVVGRLEGEEKEFYEREYPRIRASFQGYFRTKTATQKAESALGTKQLERKMRSHYTDSSPRLPNAGLQADPVFWNVAYEESPGFVEVVWDGQGEEDFEGVFIKVNDTWMLDWEHYVRFSTERWTLFQQQIGSAREGVYRVFVEKIRESGDTAVRPWIKIRLLPPYEEESRRKLEASAPIMIESDNALMGKIERLLVDRSGESEGFSKLWKRDSDELHRATLALSWKLNEKTGEDEIIINDVLSGHWRALDEDLKALKGMQGEEK